MGKNDGGDGSCDDALRSQLNATFHDHIAIAIDVDYAEHSEVIKINYGHRSSSFYEYIKSTVISGTFHKYD